MGPLEYVSSGIMTEVYRPSDVFRSREMHEDDIPPEYKLVETLFCDSSGFGSPYEPALTKEQVETRVAELLEEHSCLHSALTGIGQFQVYLSLYKRTETKAKRKRKRA